tara:strand:- start:78 stop:317 length:240 start_codon:yes stop_codon:yes gene_type:complete
MSKVDKNVISISREYLEMGGMKMTDQEWKWFCYELVENVVENVVLDLYEMIMKRRIKKELTRIEKEFLPTLTGNNLRMN